MEADGAFRDFQYLSAESGMFAVYEKPNKGAAQWWYLQPDHLGSPAKRHLASLNSGFAYGCNAAWNIQQFVIACEMEKVKYANRDGKHTSKIPNYKFGCVPNAITNCAQQQQQHATERGNSKLENIGYGLGALANLNDLWNVAFPNEKGANLYTDGDDPIISHSAWGTSETDGLLSFGRNTKNPFFYETLKGKGIDALSFGNETATELKSYAKFGLGVPRRSGYWRYDRYNNWKLSVPNANQVPLKAVAFLGKGLPYQGLTINCVNMSSLGAFMSGIPNIGIHPWLHHSSIWLYNNLRYDLHGHYFSQNR